MAIFILRTLHIPRGTLFAWGCAVWLVLFWVSFPCFGDEPLPGTVPDSEQALESTKVDSVGGAESAEMDRTAPAGDPVPLREPGMLPTSAKRIVPKAFFKSAEAVERLFDRVSALAGEVAGFPRDLHAAVLAVTDGRGWPRFLGMTALVLLVIAFGVAVEMGFRIRTADIRRRYHEIPPDGRFRKWPRLGVRTLYEAFSAGLYVVFTFVAFIILFEKGEPGYILCACALIATYYIRILALVLQILLSPSAPRLRIVPLDDAAARALNRGILLTAAVGFLFAVAANFFILAADSRRLYLLFFNLAGISVTLLVIFMVWENRHRVAEAIQAGLSDRDGCCTPLQEKLIRLWHVGTIGYVLLIGLFWEISLLMGAEDLVNRLLVSFLAIPVYLALDRWGDRMIRVSSDRMRASLGGRNGDAADFKGRPEKEAGRKSEAPSNTILFFRHSALIRSIYRVLLAGFTLFLVLNLWGIDWEMGRVVTRTLFAVIIVVAMAFLAWEAVKSAIDRKMREIAPDDEEEMEEGGAGGSRIGTLLLLLKKFILVFMVVMVVMIVLSALGVNIGPLIAGAGVVGLAIGFGAQTLVKDIISGIFFLVDDAFRVGDYVDAGKVKGLVEHISIRSLRLRHHRGMVHTIPFGELSSVTNFSRDYIITKLTFRVRYDTDVDQVRKIIKGIDKEIQKDEEMGAALIGKIKSQGVRELDDSAMIMRVKFKCVPGQQFIIRREVYRLLKEKFSEKGIRFAHRNVTVYLPSEAEPNGGPNSGEPPSVGSGERKGEKTEILDRKRAAAAALAVSSAEDEKDAAKDGKGFSK